MAGAAVLYKTEFQDSVALSSTETKFIAASDDSIFSLYFRSIMEDLQLPQEKATVIYKDNHCAYLMADAGQPTPRTKHIETCYFALLDWVERDLV